MFNSKRILGTLATIALATTVNTGAARAALLEIDFSSFLPLGEIGTSWTDSSGLKVEGLYYNTATNTWDPANLYRRNETNDHGFGVCNPNETPCPGPSGGGDINELDNSGTREAMRLTLPTGYEWRAVFVSSVDGDERGLLFADSDLNLNSTPGMIGETVLAMYDASGPVEFGIPIAPANATSPYLVFEPYDWSYGGTCTSYKIKKGYCSGDNDHLVWKVLVDSPDIEVPEPAGIALFGLGLVGFAAMRRRRAATA